MPSSSMYSTDSEEASERILARRSRIERRLRVYRGEEITGSTEDGNGQQEVERQIAESNEVLELLTLEGQELVSSVAVAGTAREVARRCSEAAARETRAQSLAEEKASAARQLKDIGAKWGTAVGQSDALELNSLLTEQRHRCEQLVCQKDEVAKKLRAELKERDLHYKQTLLEQGGELALASQRVDQQVAALSEAQRAELALLEAVTEQCRGRQVSGGGSRWAELWDALQQAQQRQDEGRAGLGAALAGQEDQLHENMAERLHEARGRLMHQSQALGLELQALRASCALNAEKMKLNTELLRRRDQEARVLRAAQKRRINKLQDRARTLQAQASSQQAESNARRKSLKERVARLQGEGQGQLQGSAVIQQQLQILGLHNAKQAATIVKQILAVDEVLHTEQLCRAWQPPEKLNSRLATLVMSLSEGRSVPTSRSTSSGALIEAVALMQSKTSIDEEVEVALRKIMLTALTKAAATFLSPDHPSRSVAAVSDDQRTLVDLASCLSALGVETEVDLKCLFSNLRPLVCCTTCDQCPYKAAHTQRDIKDSLVLKQKSCEDHVPNLSAEDVLEALKRFTASRTVESDGSAVSEHPEKISVKGGPSRQECSGWDEFDHILPDDLEELWDRLHDGLNQHLAVLQDRHELNVQVEKLRSQNSELRQLLQAYAAPKNRKIS